MEEEYVEIHDHFNKEKDTWKRTYKDWTPIFERKMSDYFVIEKQWLNSPRT